MKHNLLYVILGMLVNEPYELLEKLGSGGMGQVYRARDTRLNRIVAVKALKVDVVCTPEQRRRFLQEAQAASALNHPNIVTIHDMVFENGRELMVMEYVSGKSLRELIPPGGMPVDELIHYGVQLADALTAAHGAGIIHRDLKPGNIMVTERGLVKILDFGLAKLPSELMYDDSETRADSGPLTVEGTLLGTVAYMSPEQAEGHAVDARSDIFSLGSVLYEMATGERPFDRGNTVSTLTAVLRDQPRPIDELAAGVPTEVQEVIAQCLRKNPAERWQSAAEIYQVFLTLKHSSDSGTIQRSGIAFPPIEEEESPPAKNIWPIVAVAVMAIVLFAGAAWWFFLGPGLRPANSTAASVQPTVLRNEDVLKMLEAHVPESAIMANIAGAPASFNLSPAELVRLTKAGASEKLLTAMRGQPASAPVDVSKPSPASDSAASQPVPNNAVQNNPPTQPNSQPAANSTKAATPPAANPSPGTPNKVATPTPVVPVPPTAPPSKTPATPAAAKTVTVPDGTPFGLSLDEDIPVDIAEGSTVHLVVDSALAINGVTVLAHGAKATGTIVEGKKKKVFGSSKITYRLNAVQAVDGKEVRIRAASVAGSQSTLKHPLDFPGDKPKDVAAQKGAHFVAYIDGDVSVSSQK